MPASGIEVPAEMGLPERLVEVQHLMTRGDERACRIFETIGIYLGYAVPHYAEFYDMKNLLILGRVTSGEGGSVILAKAAEVLDKEGNMDTSISKWVLRGFLKAFGIILLGVIWVAGPATPAFAGEFNITGDANEKAPVESVLKTLPVSTTSTVANSTGFCVLASLTTPEAA